MLIEEKMRNDKMKAAIPHNSLKKFYFEGEKSCAVAAKGAY